MLQEDYANMQNQHIQNIDLQLTNLYAEQGEKLAEFLGIGEGGEGNQNSVLAAVKALIGVGEQGENNIPSMMDKLTSHISEENFKKISDQNKKLLLDEGGLQPTWGTALQNLIDGWGTTTTYITETCFANLLKANDTYAHNVDELQVYCGQEFGLIGSYITQDTYATIGLIEVTAGLTNQLLGQMSAAQGAYQAALDLANGYSQVEQTAIAAANAVMKLYAALQGVTIGDTYSPVGISNAAAVPKTSVTPKATTQSTGRNTSSGGGGTRSTAPATPHYEFISDPNGAYGTWGVRNADTGQLLEISGNKEYLQKKYPTYSAPTSNNYTVSYATGGYTGEWSEVTPDAEAEGGRLAFLHQKELVLNEGDTEKYLEALKVADVITNSVQMLNDGFHQMMTTMMEGTQQVMQTMVQGAQTVSDIINQSVNINADFSGVNDANEIKMALNNLQNRASQYATGNRRTY